MKETKETKKEKPGGPVLIGRFMDALMASIRKSIDGYPLHFKPAEFFKRDKSRRRRSGWFRGRR